MRRLLLAVTTLAVLLLVALILSAAGGRVFGHPEADNTMPLTTVMGNWLGLADPGPAGLGRGVRLPRLARTTRPVPAAPSLMWTGVPEADQRAVAATPWRAAGGTANFGERRAERRAAAGRSIRRRPQPHEFDPTWPLAVSREDLDEFWSTTRMARRDEIQLRRQFLRGLEKIFHEAKGRTQSGGCGYWLAPHLWFVAGLTRDEVTGGEEEPTFLTEVVGPPYAEVFTAAVRRYVYRLLKALQVDLIFVEDGVGYRKLVRVLRVLFEVYDKGAGRSGAEDVHFRGLTKVRVMFHDFDVDEPFRSNEVPGAEVRPSGPAPGAARLPRPRRRRRVHRAAVQPRPDAGADLVGV